MTILIGKCLECTDNKDKPLAHKKLRLCEYHNLKRRSATWKKSTKKQKQIPAQGMSKTAQGRRREDEKWYTEAWNTSPHYCEECGKYLGEEKARVYVSHILSKGAFPELRNHSLNFNILCFKHHQQWETGNKEAMNIYKKNLLTINKLHKWTQERN